MANEVAQKPGLWGWINRRLPVETFMSSQLLEYYAQKNFNFWYFFGSLALLVLVIQLLSGIFLAMFYKVGAASSFDSVEFIMREVNYGWLLRYLHSTGASAFFLVIYLHMYRGLMYGSYKAPRELLWLFGMMIYLSLMAEAFMGYVLPWGNMSFWAATVIINLFGAVPVVGPTLVEWIRGDYGVADATLNRFFSLHVAALPMVLLVLVGLHVVALHETGSNNPDGIESKQKKSAQGLPLDGIPFHPYYTVKDIFGAGVFLTLFAAVVFFVPTFADLFLEKANFEPADPLSTPDPISPSWYFTPYYAILRSVPNKGLGAVIVLVAVLAFFFLPWLDRSPVRSIRYRGWIFRTFFALFTLSFLGLMYLGLQPAEGIYVTLSRVGCVLYFAFFILMPFYSRIDPVKPVPDRVTFHA
ncbi:MAG TPA: cytochrome b N-terminal domain-containing protein [Steroidobacteraceae bacterium]|jgi:ubiquinol-cytochrome c reductase cytochrome b subunit|nr:cytochrome b N-terminal domain-containing protein [Steroidobacteraceae bacterium]